MLTASGNFYICVSILPLGPLISLASEHNSILCQNHHHTGSALSYDYRGFDMKQEIIPSFDVADAGLLLSSFTSL